MYIIIFLFYYNKYRKFVIVNNGWQFLKLSNLNIFVKSDFNKTFDSFWSTAMTDLDKSQVIGVLVKIKTDSGTYATLGPLYKVTKSNKSETECSLFGKT